MRALLDEFVPNMDPRDRSEHLPHLVSRDVKQIQRFAAYQCWIEPPEEAKTIMGYVSELVKDGSTLQIGTGTPSRFLATIGAFDDKKDLGWHSEMGIPGVIDLIRRGVITGARKTLPQGQGHIRGAARVYIQRDGLRPRKPPHRAA